MPWSAKTIKTARAVEHGFKPTGKAKGFTKGFAKQVIAEGQKRTKKAESMLGKGAHAGVK